MAGKKTRQDYMRETFAEQAAKIENIQMREADEQERVKDLLRTFHEDESYHLTMADLGSGLGPELQKMNRVMARHGINPRSMLLAEDMQAMGGGRMGGGRSEMDVFAEADAYMDNAGSRSSGGLTMDELGFDQPGYAQPQRQQRQPVRESRPAPQRASAKAAWTVVSLMAETTSGADIPVWRVACKGSPIKFDKVFRLEQVAHRIAHVLNETGDLNHPNVMRLVQAHDHRFKLVKQIRVMEKEGKRTPELSKLRGALAQLDAKLGI